MYRRSPFSSFTETTARPIFLPSVPLMKPRTECACQLVASMIAFSVVPLGCFMRARIASVLPLSRVPLVFARLGGSAVRLALASSQELRSARRWAFVA